MKFPLGGSIDHLPFEIDGQTDGNLIPRVHILRGHLFLVFSESVHSAKGDIRVSDIMLSSGQKLKVVAPLQDRAVVCRNVQAAEKSMSDI